ncbi:MAG: TonB-dependent receptor [Bacteroidetes bacterium]|nr:TonB-dependent receptor [Bacteroidota bacterium]
MRNKIIFCLLVLVLPYTYLPAQTSLTQRLRGRVIDPVLQSPLAGATVTLFSSGKTVITDNDGQFVFDAVSLGQQRLRVSYIGCRDALLENIQVVAGKETVLNISLEREAVLQQEVVVKAGSKKNKPLNEMSAVSARAFTVEETQKFAAAVNDPLRMATGFAGVVAADDGNNDIVIRGNAPTGLLWRMEGIDVPNPNHFSNAGSSGGGISILSSQLLSNSDFITGAFAAEYGNALSGVFDLRLRKGNDEKREYALQAGLLGLNASAEGPFSKGYKGSFLVNYRYSTLALLSGIGVDIVGGSTNFQDLSYNINLPTRKAGTFTLFGFTGLSSQNIKPERDSSKWDSEEDRRPGKFRSNTSANGITHSILLGAKTNLKSALAISYNEVGYEENYIERDLSLTPYYKDNYKTTKLTASSTLNHRFDNKNILRAGLIGNLIYFNYYQRSKENDDPYAPLREVINASGQTQTIQAFAQWQYRPVNYLSFNLGLHYLQLLYNNSRSLEPRASVKWDVSRRSSIALGYGLHSQVQALGVYYAQVPGTTGADQYPNRNLSFTKAHHIVLSHSLLLARDLRLKTEIYYQYLFNVPVSTSDTNSFSTLNIQGEYVTDPLVNKGKGRNYGIELSLERYLSNNLYYMINYSLYQSKYTASDGIERNTRFNGGYVSSIVAGKDFIVPGKPKSYGVNIKTIIAGGLRTTPIDAERSRQSGYTIYKKREAFSLQNDPYFRTDIGVSMKWNRARHTSTLSLDIQNVTNRLNIYSQSYDRQKGAIVTNYQNGFIPVLNYKVEF